MEKVFCISAGQLQTKKRDLLVHRRNRYLNYGLLSLASILKRNGFNTIQIQGNFDSPEHTLSLCIDHGILRSNAPVLVSIPSFYAIAWTNRFLTELKRLSPKKKIIIGGRWVVDGQIEDMKGLVPLADIVCDGVAESRILKLVTGNENATQLYSDKSEISQDTSLDYTLLHERNLYQPSIEISRGCGMKCSFCQERDEPLTPLKDPRIILKEAQSTFMDDGLTPMNFYLEASLFASNQEWSEQLEFEVSNSSIPRFNWRTEARVDSIRVKHLEYLYRAGLRVLDLGLESASCNQLIAMNKSVKPKNYLAKASELIKAAHNLGIMVKVNILLYAGETLATIDETLTWLDIHAHYITGVSVGPVIVFGWESKVKSYLRELSLLGASVASKPITGITHINLSEEIDYEKSLELAAWIGKRYCDEKDYFALKSFSYFSRDYDFDEFLSDSKPVSEQLNYRISRG
ncbi:radical SAM protein [Pseudoalteromonas ruthenica]|uniref:Radical SAM protein n=1 Tax=Pseudoalteromonas ruthenica TaxID=151081 RepID=A0A5S3Z8Y0_9GAMM|nr:radical SAM protein [Pseudoalteromonas ruthenica]TMP88699.1 radical SAM protein [Pseudoalteromonas ruthenica]